MCFLFRYCFVISVYVYEEMYVLTFIYMYIHGVQRKRIAEKTRDVCIRGENVK